MGSEISIAQTTRRYRATSYSTTKYSAKEIQNMCMHASHYRYYNRKVLCGVNKK